MSKKVDENVVSFKFDNRDFEKNTAESIKTIDKFKKNLDFTSSQNSLETLDQSIKGISFKGMISGLGDLQSKFTAVDAVVFGFFSNLGARISDATTKFIKSASIDQVSAGWNAYQTKTEAVQTIMAATSKEVADVGQRMKYVNEQLERLNWFTDETSYSFVDMTSNIGKFTSAGIDLKTSTTAMIGIANWAAISGAKTNDATRAMYNLAQALGAGYVQLMDWKTLDNVNMSTAAFKENVIKAAQELETLKTDANGAAYLITGTGKKAQKTYVTIENLSHTLAEKWLTTDVLMKTLDKYGGFTIRLNECVEETGLLTSEMLEYIDDYAKGEADIAKFVRDTGLSTEEATKMLSELADVNYAVGRAAFKAGQECKTLEDVMGYTGEAVKTLMSKIYEYIFGDYLESKELWTNWAEDLYTLFVEPVEKIRDVFGEWRNIYDESRIKEVADQFGYSAEEIEKARKIFESDDTHVAFWQWYEDNKKLTKEESKQLTQIIKESTREDFLNNLDRYADRFRMKTEDLLAARAEYVKNGKTGLKEWIEEFRRVPHNAGINLLSSFYGKLDGREVLLEGVKNIWSSIMTIVEKAREALAEIFPPLTGEGLYKLTEKFRDFTKLLVITDDRGEKIKKVFVAILKPIRFLFDVLKGIYQAFKYVAPYIWSAVKAVGKFAYAILEWVGNLLEGAKDSDIFVWIIDKLKSAFEKLKQAVKDFWGLVQEYYPKVKTWAEEGLGNMAEAFSKVRTKAGEAKSKVEGFFKSLASKKNDDGSIKEAETTFEVISIVAENTKNKVTEQVNGIWSSIVNMWNSFAQSDAGSAIIKFLKGVVDELWGVVKQLWSMFKSDPIQFIKDLASGVILVNIAKSIKGIIDTIKGSTDAFKGAIGAFKNIADSIAGFINRMNAVDPKQQKFQNIMTALKVFALVMVAVAASLYIVSKIDDYAKIGIAAGAIVGVLASIVGLIELLSKVDAVKTTALVALGVFAIAADLIASALRKVIEVTTNYEAALVAAAALTTLIAVIGALTYFLAKQDFSEKSKTNVLFASVVILSFAFASKKVAEAIAVLAGYEWQQLIAPVIAIGLLLAAVMGAIKLISVGSDKINFIGLALTFVALGVLIRTIANTIMYLGDESKRDQLIQGGIAVAAIFSALFGGLRIMQKEGASLKSAAPTFIALGVTLLILTGVIKILMGMAREHPILLLESVAAICAMLMALGVAVRIASKNLGSGGSTAALAPAFLAIGAALLMMVPMIKAFASMNVAGALIAVLATTTMIGAMVVAIKLLANINPATLLAISAAFLAIGIAVGLLGGGLLLLSSAMAVIAGNVTIVVTALTAIGAGLAAAVVAFVVGLMKAMPTIFDALYDALDATMDFLTKIQPTLSSYIVKYVARLVGTGIEALLDILVEHGVPILEKLVILIIDLLKALNKHVGELAAELGKFIVNVILALSKEVPKIIDAVFTFFESVYNGLVETMESHDMTAVLGGIGIIAEILVALGALGALAIGAMTGVAAMALLVAELAGVISVFGWIAQIDGIAELLSAGGELLGIIGTAIGKFIGGIVAGITEVASASLPVLGANLSLFMMYLSMPGGFFDGIERITPDMEQSMMYLTAAILGLTVAELINAIATILSFGGGLVKMGSDLSLFMAEIMPFVMIADLLKDKSLDAVYEIAKVMLVLTAVDLVNGIGRLFGGGHNLADFSAQLVPFGANMALFNDAIKDINPSNILAASYLMVGLGDLLKALPSDQGLLSMIFGGGSTSLEDFGKQLPGFGKHVKEFTDTVKGITKADVQGAVDASTILSELEKGLKNHGGVSQFFTGDSDIQQFGNNLIDLGKGLKDYVDTVKGITAESVQNSRNALDIMSEFEQNLDPHGGVFQFFEGDQTNADFGKNLADLGFGLKEYVTIVGDIGPDDVEKSKNALNILNDFEKSLQSHGGLDALLHGDNSLGSFGDEMKRLAAALVDFVNTCAELGDDQTEKAVNMGTKILGILKDFSGNNDVVLVTRMVTAYKNLFDSLLKLFSKETADNVRGLKDAISETLGYVANSYKDNETTAFKSGSNIMTKLYLGLRSGASAVITAMQLLFNTVSKKVNETLSPFDATGSSIIAHVITGINGSSAYLKNAILSAVKTAIQIIETDDEYKLKITPVIDYSSIQNGVWGPYAPTISLNAASRLSNAMNTPSSIVTREDMETIKSKLNSIASKVDGTTYNSTFNITGENPEVIANKVSRIIRQQQDRRLAVVK